VSASFGTFFGTAVMSSSAPLFSVSALYLSVSVPLPILEILAWFFSLLVSLI
jgi:hypothetical protein